MGIRDSVFALRRALAARGKAQCCLAFLVAGVLFCPALIAQRTPELLTFENAVELALRQNRQIHVAALEVEKLGENVSAYRTHRLPEFKVGLLGSMLLTPVSFEFQQGAFGTYQNVGPIPANDTAITTPRRPTGYFLSSVSQPLSQLYRIDLGLHSHELARDISREELRLKQHQVRNQVARVYYELAQTQSGLDAATQAVEFYTELDRVTDQFLLQQVVLKAESIEVKMRLARERLETVKLGDQLDTQQEQLNHLLGRDLRLRFRVAATPNPSLTELDLTVAQNRALEQRPEMRQAQLKVKQAEYERRAKKAEYIPDVSLSVQHLSFVNIEMLPSNVASAGLSLTWEPFDWGRKKHELAEKSKTVEQKVTALSDTEAQVLIDVNTEYRKVREAAANVQVTQLAIEASREKLRVTTDSYRVQAVRLDQVLEAQTGVSTAVSQHQRALSNYWQARADLEKATGED
jgi:outer membrane protein TolC